VFCVIKAGKSGTLKSLHRFIWEKGLKKAIRFDLNPPSVMKVSHKVAYDRESADIDFELLSLPLYMVEQVSRLFPTMQ
jgi:hypothetical protein